MKKTTPVIVTSDEQEALDAISRSATSALDSHPLDALLKMYFDHFPKSEAPLHVTTEEARCILARGFATERRTKCISRYEVEIESLGSSSPSALCVLYAYHRIAPQQSPPTGVSGVFRCILLWRSLNGVLIGGDPGFTDAFGSQGSVAALPDWQKYEQAEDERKRAIADRLERNQRQIRESAARIEQELRSIPEGTSRYALMEEYRTACTDRKWAICKYFDLQHWGVPYETKKPVACAVTPPLEEKHTYNPKCMRCGNHLGEVFFGASVTVQYHNRCQSCQQDHLYRVVFGDLNVVLP